MALVALDERALPEALHHGAREDSRAKVYHARYGSDCSMYFNESSVSAALSPRCLEMCQHQQTRNQNWRRTQEKVVDRELLELPARQHREPRVLVVELEPLGGQPQARTSKRQPRNPLAQWPAAWA